MAGASLQPATRFTVHNPNAAYGVDFWREADGFAQSRVRAIVQTRDGYVWLGTDGGLVRFNGETFTAYATQTGALKDNEIWALQEDAGGGLWIGTYGGGLTYLKDGRFRTYTTDDGLPDDVIMSLATDSQGGSGSLRRKVSLTVRQEAIFCACLPKGRRSRHEPQQCVHRVRKVLSRRRATVCFVS